MAITNTQITISYPIIFNLSNKLKP